LAGDIGVFIMAMEFMEEELIKYNGYDSSKRIYMELKQRVFDVSNGKNF